MAKDDSTVRCFQGLLIFGNVIIGCCGIALTAECIFFVSDQHSLYPLLEATDNDDIYGAAWIGIFVGICLFCLSVLGIVGIMKSSRKILLAYFILMFIVYAFEVASCITAATQRDFFTPNLFLKQMLERYQNNSPPNNDDQWKNNGVTKTWDRLMLQDNCCGVNGPSDWQKYTSAFRTENNDADYPWPRQCCVMNNLKEPLNLEACKLGVPGFYHNQGCYELISGPMNRHAWGVAWFGFAILCWTGFGSINFSYTEAAIPGHKHFRKKEKFPGRSLILEARNAYPKMVHTRNRKAHWRISGLDGKKSLAQTRRATPEDKESRMRTGIRMWGTEKLLLSGRSSDETNAVQIIFLLQLEAVETSPTLTAELCALHEENIPVALASCSQLTQTQAAPPIPCPHQVPVSEAERGGRGRTRRIGGDLPRLSSWHRSPIPDSQEGEPKVRVPTAQPVHLSLARLVSPE
ncbi:uroplakin-1b [Pongo abelii]